MPTYRVREGARLAHGGQVLEGGALVSLTADVAADTVVASMVDAVPEPAPGPSAAPAAPREAPRAAARPSQPAAKDNQTTTEGEK